MIALQLLELALLLCIMWMLLLLHPEPSAPEPPVLTEAKGSPPVHQRELQFLLCNAQGRLKTEVTTYNYADPPDEFESGGVRYTRHRLHKHGAEYRPKVVK